MEKLNFPDTVGAIDCTHVAVTTPKPNQFNPAITYLNRKGYYSINVQGVISSY